MYLYIFSDRDTFTLFCEQLSNKKRACSFWLCHTQEQTAAYQNDCGNNLIPQIKFSFIGEKSFKNRVVIKIEQQQTTSYMDLLTLHPFASFHMQLFSIYCKAYQQQKEATMEPGLWLYSSHLSRFQRSVKNACHFSGLYVPIECLCFFLSMVSLGNAYC